jgi:alpha-tubulin suppressor-like RCC1 family protein
VTATAIAAGYDHSLAVTSTGQVYAWGANFSGELGNGTVTATYITTPVAVDLPSGVRASAVAAGYGHSLALTHLGHVWAWGLDGGGELGTGPTGERVTPTPVRLFAPGSGVTATAIAASSEDSVALTSTGQVYAWGFNGEGQLGTGTTTGPRDCFSIPCSPTPVAVGLPSGVTATAIATGGNGLEGGFGLALDP